MCVCVVCLPIDGRTGETRSIIISGSNRGDNSSRATVVFLLFDRPKRYVAKQGKPTTLTAPCITVFHVIGAVLPHLKGNMLPQQSTTAPTENSSSARQIPALERLLSACSWRVDTPQVITQKPYLWFGCCCCRTAEYQVSFLSLAIVAALGEVRNRYHYRSSTLAWPLIRAALDMVKFVCAWLGFARV